MTEWYARLHTGHTHNQQNKSHMQMLLHSRSQKYNRQQTIQGKAQALHGKNRMAYDYMTWHDMTYIYSHYIATSN